MHYLLGRIRQLLKIIFYASVFLFINLFNDLYLFTEIQLNNNYCGTAIIQHHVDL